MGNVKKILSVKNIAIASLSLVALVLLSASATYAATTGAIRITSVVQGGTARPSDFTLEIKNGNSTISGSGNSITFSGFSAGTYTITNSDGPSGYSVIWSGDCTPQGTVTIVPPLIKMCTATFVFGSVGILKVNTVINGGTAVATDFTMHLKKSGEADTGSPTGSGAVVTFDQLAPGSYTVIQSLPPVGYSLSWSGACNAAGNVTVVGNATVTCIATNTFTSTGGGDSGRTRTPSTPRPPR